MKWLAVDYGDSRTGLAGCDAIWSACVQKSTVQSFK